MAPKFSNFSSVDVSPGPPKVVELRSTRWNIAGRWPESPLHAAPVKLSGSRESGPGRTMFPAFRGWRRALRATIKDELNPKRLKVHITTWGFIA